MDSNLINSLETLISHARNSVKINEETAKLMIEKCEDKAAFLILNNSVKLKRSIRLVEDLIRISNDDKN